MDPSPKLKTKMLPAGWAVLILGIVGCLLLGFIRADGVMLTFSFLFVILLTGCRIWGRFNLAKIEVSVDLPERVHAAKGFDLEVFLDNKKSWLDSYFIDLSLNILNKLTFEASTRWVSAGNGAGVKERISIPIRSTGMKLEASLKSQFPLNLFTHQRKISLLHPMVVYPRTIVPIELMTCGSMNDIDPKNGSQFGESLGEPRGIRAWQPGDSAKRIHWPASARSMVRGQGLRVREYDPPGFTPLTCSVIFHSHAEAGEVFRQDRFERATSLAAGTLKFLHSRQVDVNLVADFLGWQPHPAQTRSQFIDTLAILAGAKRSLNTELHELQSIVDKYQQESDQLVIVSDLDPDAWSDGLELPENALVVDIRQMKFKRRGFVKPGARA